MKRLLPVVVLLYPSVSLATTMVCERYYLPSGTVWSGTVSVETLVNTNSHTCIDIRYVTGGSRVNNTDYTVTGTVTLPSGEKKNLTRTDNWWCTSFSVKPNGGLATFEGSLTLGKEITTDSKGLEIRLTDQVGAGGTTNNQVKTPFISPTQQTTASWTVNDTINLGSVAPGEKGSSVVLRGPSLGQGSLKETSWSGPDGANVLVDGAQWSDQSIQQDQQIALSLSSSAGGNTGDVTMTVAAELACP